MNSLKKLKILIKEVLKNKLEEDALKLSDIENQNLCLAVSNKGGGYRIILFDGDRFFDYVRAKYNKEIVSPNSYKDIVYGMIKVINDRQCGFYQVTMSVAKKGYGPTMYDIVMSYIYPNYLVSDRMSVSSEAQKVWKYMVINRKNDFDIVPLVNPNCKYGKEGPETEFLNFKFRIKNKLNTDKLVQNTADVINDLLDDGIDPKFASENLTGLSELMFATMVKDN